jgi:hypothetical protein
MLIQKIKNLTPQVRKNLLVATVTTLVVGVVGCALVITHASSLFATIEPESGTASGNTSIVNDSNASGGKAVQFNAPAAPPSGGGGGGAGSSCPLPAYPTPSCAGLPAGITFTNTVNGDYTATTAGQHIDKWHITGNLDIRASGVVITNSQIDVTVNNDSGSVGGVEQYPSFTISDSTVGPPGACTSAGGTACVNSHSNSTASCQGSPGVGEGNFTATRVYVRGHDDGFRVGGPNVTVQDSYFYACFLNATLAPPDGSHSDGVQSYCSANPACSDINLLHNTLDLSGVPATFPVNLGDVNQSVVIVSNNLLLGGQNYLMYMPYHGGPVWTVSNNRLVKDTWVTSAPWPRVDGAVTAENTCSHETWSGNTAVTIDSNYAIASTVGTVPCVD